ncbi:hypothetical protein [Hymenobacter gummosus]|nr:hypothetical protein [Hymenobacter gummosus]
MRPSLSRLPLWARVLLTYLLLFLLALAAVALLFSLGPDIDTQADVDRNA